MTQLFTYLVTDSFVPQPLHFIYILENDLFATFELGTPVSMAYDPEIRTWLRFLYDEPTHQVLSF